MYKSVAAYILEAIGRVLVSGETPNVYNVQKVLREEMNVWFTDKEVIEVLLHGKTLN